jgi:hypothetical protein
MRILTIFVCLMLGVSDVGYNGGKKVMTYLQDMMGSRKENELQKGYSEALDIIDSTHKKREKYLNT